MELYANGLGEACSSHKDRTMYVRDKLSAKGLLFLVVSSGLYMALHSLAISLVYAGPKPDLASD